MSRQSMLVECDPEDIELAMRHQGKPRGQVIAELSRTIHALPPRGARDVRSFDSPFDRGIYIRWQGDPITAPTAAEIVERIRARSRRVE